jgi:hypothetical protein
MHQEGIDASEKRICCVWKNIQVAGKVSWHGLIRSPFKNSQSRKKYLMRKPNKL